MEKQASGHATVLKRQDLRGLLKSDLRGTAQTCANWRRPAGRNQNLYGAQPPSAAGINLSWVEKNSINSSAAALPATARLARVLQVGGEVEGGFAKKRKSHHGW